MQLYYKTSVKYINNFIDSCNSCNISNSNEKIDNDFGSREYIRNNKLIALIEFSDSENIIISKYLNGYHVYQLGYKNQSFMSNIDEKGYAPNVKVLTIQHDFQIEASSFLNLNTVKATENANIVELRKSDRNLDIIEFKLKAIIILEYVKVIEKCVVYGLEEVTIKTSYSSRPYGWKSDGTEIVMLSGGQ